MDKVSLFIEELSAGCQCVKFPCHAHKLETCLDSSQNEVYVNANPPEPPE